MAQYSLLQLIRFAFALFTVGAHAEASPAVRVQRQIGGNAGNVSALPPLWTPFAVCWEDFFQFNGVGFLLGPSITLSDMTIEVCVDYCDAGSFRMAGTTNGDTCRCGNMFYPFSEESLTNAECDIPCAGNAAEKCGASDVPGLWVLGKDDGLVFDLQGRDLSALIVGDWRLSYVYNDTVGARALEHNAVDLHPGLPRGNLTIETCLNACAASGYTIAGQEFADECYCGNELLHSSRPVPGVSPSTGAMACKGDVQEMCGGPNRLQVYVQEGAPANVLPLVPFGINI
ncbi:hypothetical protein GGX14DRAFT_701408 [Mycena pura]|uniref:WSC domain-containing protein n=1 Tax=Mycena pura TaxID=153505 RepID=A0AAD6Y3A0_9AGAR|nr:hypothetical protein GGX14DRAFT_701408 [Mycena pura]